MHKPYPTHITSEKDLKLYEDFLETEIGAPTKNDGLTCTVEPRQGRMISPNRSAPATTGSFSSTMFFQGYLKNHIGKLVKVESLLGNCLENRIGVLFEVGANYIVLKLHKSACSMMIEASSIKYITIIHDNDVNKTFY